MKTWIYSSLIVGLFISGCSGKKSSPFQTVAPAPEPTPYLSVTTDRGIRISNGSVLTSKNKIALRATVMPSRQRLTGETVSAKVGIGHMNPR